MAIVSDRKKLYEKQIAEAEQRRELAAKKVVTLIPRLLYNIVTLINPRVPAF